MNNVRKIIKSPLIKALSSRSIRGRVIYELRSRYFEDLNFSIPLGENFHCPITEADSAYSFSEIFVNSEYADFLQRIPFPRRWLDLGCHAGYFSLYLAWQRAVRKLEGEYQALLVDADGRAKLRVTEMLRVNPLAGKFVFQHGAISRTPGEVRFAQRGGMGSSLDFTDPTVSAVEVVQVIDAAALANLLPPPYDLIKIDIEGAEMDFMEAYEPIYRQAKWLIVEWHSWDMEGLNEKVVREGFEARGFRVDSVLKPKKSGLVDGLALSTGTHLFERI